MTRFIPDRIISGNSDGASSEHCDTCINTNFVLAFSSFSWNSVLLADLKFLLFHFIGLHVTFVPYFGHAFKMRDSH
jgi:hypothetical protein